MAKATEKVEEVPAPEPKSSVEDLCRKHGTPDWLFGAASAMARWGIGHVVTESEYLSTLDRAANAKMTPGNPFIESK